MKKLVLLFLAVTTCLLLGACQDAAVSNPQKEKLVIAHQYGMAYAPFQIMKEQNLIEKYYNDVQIEWTVLNSGSAINEGFASGSIDVGAMGVAPAITGVVKKVPYKIFSGMSAQPHAVMTNKASIKSLKDITADDKIALVNLGSIQHILLSMAAEAELQDPHALDNNIVAMSHPDGMIALTSGSVSCQLTTSPYIFKELENEDITITDSISKVWPEGNSFIVGMASTKLHDENPDLYNAVVKAMQDAIDYMNANKEETAKMLCKEEDVDQQTMLEWLNNPACVYSSETKGVMQMADYMARTGFIEEGPVDFSIMAYDNVRGN